MKFKRKIFPVCEDLNFPTQFILNKLNDKILNNIINNYSEILEEIKDIKKLINEESKGNGRIKQGT